MEKRSNKEHSQDKNIPNGQRKPVFSYRIAESAFSRVMPKLLIDRLPSFSNNTSWDKSSNSMDKEAKIADQVKMELDQIMETIGEQYQVIRQQMQQKSLFIHPIFGKDENFDDDKNVKDK
jgi:hypothetical protein